MTARRSSDLCAVIWCLYEQVVACPWTWLLLYECWLVNFVLVRGLLQESILIQCIVSHCKRDWTILIIRQCKVYIIKARLYPSSVTCEIDMTMLLRYLVCDINLLIFSLFVFTSSCLYLNLIIVRRVLVGKNKYLLIGFLQKSVFIHRFFHIVKRTKLSP